MRPINPDRTLKVGIPKGSLEHATIELFAQAGWRISVSSRNYFPSVDDPDLYCALVRPQEMGPYIANGTLDLGLTGNDWLIERDSQDAVVKVCDLIYSKASDQPCRWVLVAPQGSPIQCIEDLQGKRVATELVGFTRRYLAERNIQAEVEFSWGATEAKVVEGLADAAVEITETGSTIRAHGLREVHTLLETNTVLIANPGAWDHPWKRHKIDQIALLLQASLTARQKVALKMMVPRPCFEQVNALLPSLKSPTVSPAHDPAWLAVETVVDSHRVRDLIPALRAAGAEGILEYALQKVV